MTYPRDPASQPIPPMSVEDASGVYMTACQKPQPRRVEDTLIPTVAICGGACAMCAAYIGYMAVTKPDFSYTPWKYATQGPYQAVKPTEVRKMINLHKFTPNPEVEALKAEINSNYKA